jgi:lipopolysaccharide transport system permease protein
MPHPVTRRGDRRQQERGYYPAVTSNASSAWTTVIKPPGRWPGLALGELLRYRSICAVLVRRSLMVRYRQTIVGAAWTLLQPVSMMIVFTVFFGILSRVPSDNVPYPVFVYAGLLIFQVVAKILNEGSTSVVSNSSLITKIYFPRIYLPVSVAISALVDMAFSLVAFVVLLAWYGIVPGPSIVALPVLLAIALGGALGVSFWLSALNAAYRDVTQLLPFLTQLWMFTSPVIYPSSLIPETLRPLYWLNPLAVAIDGFRWMITGVAAPPLTEWLIGATVAAILLATGYLFFRRREPTFSDVV